MLYPETSAELSDLVQQKKPLHLIGKQSRLGLHGTEQAQRLSTQKLCGITLYEPSEMVLKARAGTPLIEIEQLLANHKQRLPFEPLRLNRLYHTSGESTIGGVAATNASGPRRLYGGACRDSMIGVTFINGLGQEIKSGGRVMKDVTGYDLVKLMAGSYGALGILTEIAFKLSPMPEIEATLLWHGLDVTQAVELLTSAIGSPFEVTGAAYLDGKAMLRLEGFEDSVSYRINRLQQRFKLFGEAELSDGAPWHALRDCPLTSTAAIWRITTAPTRAPLLIETIKGVALDYALDWGGGLIWLGSQDNEEAARFIRQAALQHRGNATLMRSSAAYISPFQPQSAGVKQLSLKVKAALDPHHLFKSSMMGA